MESTGTRAILRVSSEGVVVAADDGAVGALGPCVGRSCRSTVAAFDRDHAAVCTSGCASAIAHRHTAPRNVDGVVVRDRIGRLSCTRVGDENVVVLELGGHRARAYPERLTGRERDVLREIARGLTNPQIGTRLGVSASTVRTHVEHVLAKLGATSRAHAVQLGRELGEL